MNYTEIKRTSKWSLEKCLILEWQQERCRINLENLVQVESNKCQNNNTTTIKIDIFQKDRGTILEKVGNGEFLKATRNKTSHCTVVL